MFHRIKPGTRMFVLPGSPVRRAADVRWRPFSDLHLDDDAVTTTEAIGVYLGRLTESTQAGIFVMLQMFRILCPVTISTVTSDPNTPQVLLAGPGSVFAVPPQ